MTIITATEAAQKLRQRAEAKHQIDKAVNSQPLSPMETERLIHELEVHQIELEMQNDELRRTQIELEAERARDNAIAIQSALEYFENIVETVREPLLVLCNNLKILSANSSFYSTFNVEPAETIGRFIYDLGNHQWDIPKLRLLLEDIIPKPA
jgi:PAS domain-containing protein